MAAHPGSFERVPLLAYGLGAIFAIELSSSTAYHAKNLQLGAVEGFTGDVRLLVEMGRLVTGPDYLKAEQLRAALIAEITGKGGSAPPLR